MAAVTAGCLELLAMDLDDLLGDMARDVVVMVRLGAERVPRPWVNDRAPWRS